MASVPSGVLNVIKPPGPTSHDIVADIRRRLPRKTRVGHAGTLDPAAAGVLVIMVGAATRLSPYLTGRPKLYRAEIVFGLETDTADAEGEPVAVNPAGHLTAAQVKGALTAFTGTIEQVPPATSAIKVDGVPLHRRTRRGEQVEPPPRRVTVHSARLIRWHDHGKHPKAVVDVYCGPGTYIRSLARDLGRHVGCGAMLGFLLRLGSGSMTVNDGFRLEELPRRGETDRWAEFLTPMARAMDFLPGVVLSDDDAEAAAHGRPLGPRPVDRWQWVPAAPEAGRDTVPDGRPPDAALAGDPIPKGDLKSPAAPAPDHARRTPADDEGDGEEHLVRLLDGEGRLIGLARPRWSGPAPDHGRGGGGIGFAPRRVFPPG